MVNLSLDQFFTFWTGIYCDYDGAYGDQCFDLANAYSRWIGGQRFTGATADLIFNQPGDFYTQIKNTPDGIPQRGDIVIWNWPHVGIATGNNSSTTQFEVLEQNDPTNSDCHIKVYLNYNGVIGWLRPKQFPQDPQAIIDQLRTDRDKNYNLYLDEQSKYQGVSDQLAKATEENGNLQTQLTACLNKPPQTVPAPPTTIPSDPSIDLKSCITALSLKSDVLARIKAIATSQWWFFKMGLVRDALVKNNI